jgi:drug/metabolite transporter (DMT)-like permease
MVSGFYRMAIAAAVMALPFGARAGRRAPLSRRHIGLAVLAGLFFAGDLAAWNTGVLITNAANATLFGNTSPFWVSLGALVLFKEKLRPTFWGGLLMAMLGAAVILGGDFLTYPRLGLGDLLALLAGFFYGGFFLATQRARECLGSLVSWWVSACASAVALLLLSLIFRQPLTGYPLGTYACLLALALVTQVGGYISINYALGYRLAHFVRPAGDDGAARRAALGRGHQPDPNRGRAARVGWHCCRAPAARRLRPYVSGRALSIGKTGLSPRPAAGGVAGHYGPPERQIG